MKPFSYLIVGSGYRAEYYGRIAAAFPYLFRAMFLCRSQEKADRMTRHTGMPASVSPDECLAFRPDFVVVAVDRGHVAQVTLEWAGRGFPVAGETAIGSSREELNALWAAAQRGAKITCLEQYPRCPILSAGLSAVSQGAIGTPVSAYLSLLHDYHAAALLRLMLGTRGETWTLRGERTRAEIAETDSRYGAILDGSVSERVRDVVHITYASGKTAVYDFSSLQYRSFIRSRHLVLRGTRGEWNDTWLYSLDEQGVPSRTALTPAVPEAYRCLDSQALRDLRRTWRGELTIETVQDEFAIATMLLDMGAFAAGGPSPYPLEDALDDALLWLTIEEAVQQPWQAVSSGALPWRNV